MAVFDSKHAKISAFEHLAPLVRVEANHVTAGHWLRGWHGHNRIPHNRLFCIYGPNQAGSVRTPEQRMDMRAGFIYHLPPNIAYDMEFAVDLKMLAFHYDCHLGNGLDLSMGVRVISERPFKRSAIKAYTESLVDMDQRSALIHGQGLLYQLAAMFIHGDVQSLYEQHQLQQRYQAVLDEIDLAGAETRIPIIAELMDLSVDQLSKRFRRDIGIPLKHFIDQRIVKQAAQMLRQSDQKIKDIAQALQFRDEFTFSRFVRKHLGMSPRKYRQLPDIERI